MSQKLKFRAWHLAHQKMIYSVNLYSMRSDRMVRAQLDNGPVMLTIGLHCDIMQWVGAVDKNLKEIYERDIVIKTAYNKSQHKQAHFMGQVFIEDCAVQIMFRNGNLSGWEDFSSLRHYEVIGNAYEHPHLLQKSTL